MPGSCTLRSAPTVCNFCIATSNANRQVFFVFVFFGGGCVCKVCLYFTEGKRRGKKAFIKPVAPLLSVLHTALSLAASTSLALFPTRAWGLGEMMPSCRTLLNPLGKCRVSTTLCMSWGDVHRVMGNSSVNGNILIVQSILSIHMLCSTCFCFNNNNRVHHNHHQWFLMFC